jgi:hypothetical protein
MNDDQSIEYLNGVDSLLFNTQIAFDDFLKSNQLNYRFDAMIDMNNLHIECKRLSFLISEYSRLKSDITFKISHYEKRQAKIKGLIVDSMMRTAKEKKLKNPTIAEIDSEVSLDEDYDFITDKIIDAKYKESTLKGVIRGLEKKDGMINEAIYLFSIGYFNGETDSNRDIQKPHLISPNELEEIIGDERTKSKLKEKAKQWRKDKQQ